VAAGLSAIERLLSLVTPVRAGEGRVVALMFAKGFLLLFAYYLVKPAREALILTEGSAELRSYAVAFQALILIAIIPVYTAVFRRIFPHYHLVAMITAFLALNLPIFVLCANAGYQVGLEFFIWLGIFNVLIVAQFWAFAADLFNVEAGERLFVLIMLGTSLGAWAGAVASKVLMASLGPYGLMLLTMVLLLATIPLIPLARRAVPDASRAPRQAAHPEEVSGFWGGLRLVVADPYLRLIAVFVLLLNCINTTGEYILARVVKDHAAALAASGAITDAGAWIGEFYGDFYAWLNFLGLVVQLLFVARIFRAIGVGGGLLIIPAVSAAVYGLLIFVPVFAVVRVAKIVENSLNYSLQKTAANALMLPLDEEAKYAGKTTIDTLFWRIGDLVQAGIVWAGYTWLSASVGQFALMNFALSLVWFAAAYGIAGRYRRMTARAPATAG
jgi:ATP:ADP antiporter, AAA family